MRKSVTRRTRVFADLYTREVYLDDDRRAALYIGEEQAHELSIRLTNRGRPVLADGYIAMCSYILPNEEMVTSEGRHVEKGWIQERIPARVHLLPGDVVMGLTLISPCHIQVAMQMKIVVSERKDMLNTRGYDVGNLIPSVAQMIMMLRRVEVALGYIDPEDESGKLIADKVLKLQQEALELQGFMNRTAGFATAEQGRKADAALPAASYTAQDVLEKLKEVGGAASGLDADTLDGLHAAAFATAEQGARADAALSAAGYTAQDVLTKLKGVDGASSGLDADLLDGQHASYFAVASKAMQLVVSSSQPTAASNVLWVQV